LHKLDEVLHNMAKPIWLKSGRGCVLLALMIALLS